MGCFPQNAARNAEIIRRRKEGQWPRQIAAEMGLGKNVVIGVTNRAGLAVPGAQYLACTGGRGSTKNRGERHGMAVLTEERVRYIRAKYMPRHRTFGATAMARQFGVTANTIFGVISGRRWKHLSQPPSGEVVG